MSFSKSAIKYIGFGLCLMVITFLYATLYYGFFPYDQLNHPAAGDVSRSQPPAQEVLKDALLATVFISLWAIIPLLTLIYSSWRSKPKQALLHVFFVWAVIALVPTVVLFIIPILMALGEVEAAEVAEWLEWYTFFLIQAMLAFSFFVFITVAILYGLIVNSRIKYGLTKTVPLFLLAFLIIGLPAHRLMLKQNENSCGIKFSSFRVLVESRIRTLCNAAHSVEKNDISQCFAFDKYGNNPQLCTKLVARAQKNVSACSRLKDYGVQDEIDCYMNVIEETKNASLCDDLKDPYENAYCYTLAAVRLNDTSICNNKLSGSHECLHRVQIGE